MFSTVAVANGGEVAIRTYRAACGLRIETVAVRLGEDRPSIHQSKAEEALCQIGEQAIRFGPIFLATRSSWPGWAPARPRSLPANSFSRGIPISSSCEPRRISRSSGHLRKPGELPGKATALAAAKATNMFRLSAVSRCLSR
ncbi:biotin carboxylase N-terminal domain-containing protein [Rhodococcus jostii]|uniref:biotin carboxylase N-terminal domain-containing protein n=1 Tax=Rhodococcus jostii TaxID=132919 RepID=UPI00093486B8|nr:biotin carboxylase N-terminal domain-containing protein [Rhodococcus jostii]